MLFNWITSNLPFGNTKVKMNAISIQGRKLIPARNILHLA